MMGTELLILGLDHLFAFELPSFRVASSELDFRAVPRTPSQSTTFSWSGASGSWVGNRQGVHLAFSTMEIPDLQSGLHPSWGKLDIFDP
eukprot:s54_g30.t1